MMAASPDHYFYYNPEMHRFRAAAMRADQLKSRCCTRCGTKGVRAECGVCLNATYCSERCMQADWDAHRRMHPPFRPLPSIPEA